MAEMEMAAAGAELPAGEARDFSVSLLSLPGSVAKWPLAMKFLRLRKDVFIDQMNWGLFHAEGVEFEQYDSIGVTYVVAHRAEQVIGGARLVCTTNSFGSGEFVYTYMIRDACRGLLANMPTGLCAGEPPVSGKIWELTRLVAIKEPGIAEAILASSNRFLHAIAAEQCLFLGPPAFMRMAKRMGFSPSPLGDIQGNVDGRFLAFSCDVIPPEEVVEYARTSGASPALSRQACPASSPSR